MEEKKQKPFAPGEKGFAFALLIFGAFFLWQSWKLYQAHPGADAAGAMPLFVSALIVIFSICIIVSDWKAPSVNHGLSFGEQAKKTLGYIFQIDVLVEMGLILAYCFALNFGLGFYIATPVFLWVSMCYLMRKDYVKNLLWTALCMAFIIIVFRFIFSVVLP